MSHAGCPLPGRTIWITPGAGRIPSTPRQREDMISTEAGNKLTFWATYVYVYIYIHIDVYTYTHTV